MGISVGENAMFLSARFFLKILVGSVVLVSLTQIQAANAAGEVPLPAQNEAWINSSPITAQSLQGKAAFLYFFEEDCPRCRARWPELLATAKKFADKPIVFIGVNSGSSRDKIEAYARDCNINWPILLDPSRDFEKSCGVPEISLQNIYQAKIIDGSGKLGQGDWSNVEGSAERALAGAKWRVDPAGIPAALKPTWISIETGNYAAAAPLVKKGLAAANPEIKAAATKLNEAVLAQAAPQVEEAQQALAAGNKWPAYKGFVALGERFAGYDLPGDIEAQKKLLVTDEQVKKELTALKSLDAARRAAKSSPSARRGAITRLKKLIEDFPGTDAAKDAQGILDQIGAG